MLCLLHLFALHNHAPDIMLGTENIVAHSVVGKQNEPVVTVSSY